MAWRPARQVSMLGSPSSAFPLAAGKGPPCSPWAAVGDGPYLWAGPNRRPGGRGHVSPSPRPYGFGSLAISARQGCSFYRTVIIQYNVTDVVAETVLAPAIGACPRLWATLTPSCGFSNGFLPSGPRGARAVLWGSCSSPGIQGAGARSGGHWGARLGPACACACLAAWWPLPTCAPVLF